MSNKRVTTQHHATFDGIRRFDIDGNEFWMARALGKAVDYSEYRHFLRVLREACENSGQLVHDHFEDVLDMVEIGSGAKRELEDIRLSRYACYLLVQKRIAIRNELAIHNKQLPKGAPDDQGPRRHHARGLTDPRLQHSEN